MKKAIVFILILFSCNSNSRVKKDNLFVSENNVIGSWQICQSISKSGIKTSYNVCPVIVFDKDGTGNIVFSSKRKCLFNYKINEEKVLFSFKNQDYKNLFISKNDSFEYIIYNNQGRIVCELIDKKTECKFILGKSK